MGRNWSNTVKGKIIMATRKVPAETVLMKLATEKSVIDRASKAVGDKTFRDTLTAACADYLDAVEKYLLAAGCTPSEDEAAVYRIRPIPPAVHQKLKNVAEATGISMATVLRCCLNLLARDGAKTKADTPGASEVSPAGP
jgi:hypothetical protein